MNDFAEDNTDSEAAAGPPPDTRFDRFEERLNSISSALSDIDRNQQVRDVQTRIAQRSAQVDRAVRDAEHAVDSAEGALAEAHESGDGAVIAKAQRALSERIAAREHAKVDQRNHKRAIQEVERRTTGSEGSPGQNNPQKRESSSAESTNLLDNWKKKHSSWYGVDADMTRAAHEIDRSIREAGVIPVGSQQYFDAVNRQMAKRYPEQLRDVPDTASGGGGQRSGERPSSGRIPREVVDGWERMGINTRDPATMERMVGHRKVLADKGVLPEQPAYGMVRPR